MPSLTWTGRKAVENLQNEIPYRLLRKNEEQSFGESSSGNLLVQADNLEALKALLPYYRGSVKCIYIDPPYNTGNEGWSYNDAVNSPEMRAWLGQTVGKQSEDLCRHDKWLCLMYPRLALLKDFLREDGAIFVSIDDNEVHQLRALMDEIWGSRCFIATIIWQKVYAPKNSARHFSEDHDYIVVYAKNPDLWKPQLIPRTEGQDSLYKNPDNDPRGPWMSDNISARNPYSEGIYSIECPSGRVIEAPPKGRYWAISKTTLRQLDADKRIWWGKEGNGMPRLKRFLSEVKEGRTPQTFWSYKEVGHTQEAKQELLSICDFEDSASVFISPKPTRLIERILQIATDQDSIVLDSFAGSGTTGQATLSLNRKDGGQRRFVLVEMDEDICRKVTHQRLSRVIAGYEAKRTGGKREPVAGLGSGFDFCELGDPLFEENGNIRPNVSFPDLARHVYFCETNNPLQSKGQDFSDSPLIGISGVTAVYLLFNGILGDKRPEGGNVLTMELLNDLPSHDGQKVIYGEACLLSSFQLKRLGITFKQTPYDVRGR